MTTRAGVGGDSARPDPELEGTGSGEPPRIVPNKNRRVQVAPAPGRRKLFDEAAQDEFLEWFAATCNCSLSARKTGFHYRTVLRHWREDEAFGARCEAALHMGYPRLEELALRAAVEALSPERRKPPKGDRPPPPEHFKMDPMTAVQLLREHKRHLAGLAGGSGRDAKPGPKAKKKWTFDEAIAALDKRLRSLGLRYGIPEDWEPGRDGGEPGQDGGEPGRDGGEPGQDGGEPDQGGGDEPA